MRGPDPRRYFPPLTRDRERSGLTARFLKELQNELRSGIGTEEIFGSKGQLVGLLGGG